jgi:hypothetical protein
MGIGDEDSAEWCLIREDETNPWITDDEDEEE